MSKLKRRHFILGTLGAAGALVVGWSAAPLRQRLTPSSPLPTAPGQSALNGWVKIGADDSVTIIMSQVEMGQGSHTGLAMLLADELDADWSKVRLEQSNHDAIYNNQKAIIDALPFQPDDDGIVKRGTGHVVAKLLREIPGMSGTGGSSSIKDLWLPMREAGASARAMLIAAAAARWRVAPASCRTDAGRVLHDASNRSSSYGELAAAAALQAVPERVALKRPAEFKLIGKPVHRIDSAAKLNGTAVYGIDAQPDGLLYASIVMCPTLGGKVLGFDGAAALRAPGVRKIVALAPVEGGIGSTGATSGGVAVIADTPWHAMRAVALLKVEWDHGPAAGISSAAVIAALADTLRHNEGRASMEHGDSAAVIAASARTVSAAYTVPMLAHATMEPMNCTAQFKDGQAIVWAPTQAAGFARSAVAKALAIDAAHVDIRVPFLGGGFGRRYLSDCIIQASLLARETGGAPVQLIWSREQDMTHDFYRPAFAARCVAGLDAQGKLLAWRSTSAGTDMGVPAFLGAATDGAFNNAYAFPAARVAHQTLESPLPLGIWRSVGHSQNAFFTESFLDECAAAGGRDPVALRADLLRGNPRHLRVLHRAAALANWGAPMTLAADGAPRARGIALHRCFGTIVAQVAEVSVTADRGIRVHRVICVVDCGYAVNPNLVRQQMESAIVFGLSAALQGEITIENGQVRQTNFHSYAPLRIDQCPVIETDIIASSEAPGGVGEPGTPPVAPAVANAVFALTGQRLRALPLKLA